MKLLLSVFALFAFVVGFAEQANKPKVFFMFFVKGEGARPTDPKESEAVTKTHFSNMAEQVERGKLVAAGPLKDPTEVRRGITVLTLEDRRELANVFKRDEFVKRDMMRVEAAEWEVDAARFNPKVETTTIVDHRLVLLKTGPGKSPETEAMRQQHKEYLDSLMKTHGLAVWGRLLPSDDKAFLDVREALIFLGDDTEGIEKALAKDIFVQRGLLTVEVLPLWMSKGVVGG